MNNKFWSKIKKISMSLILVIIIASGSLLSGCFSFSEDGASVNDVLYGVRMTYIKASLEKGDYVAVPDETFVKDLQQQYLDMAVEILLSLTAKYGRGIKDFNSVKNNLPENFGEITLDSILYMEELSSDSNEYDLIIGEESQWLWGQSLNVDEHTGADKFASEFCSPDNLFKMQVALYLINMGVDCMKINYGDGGEYFMLSPDKDSLKKLASNANITHSGLIEEEQSMLVDFILNNVIATNSAYYKTSIKDIIKEIFEQTSGTDPNGNAISKYPVVASVMVKDYKVKDIASDKSDSLDEDSEEDDEENEDNSEFFTMELGQQFYKSLVFMPKTEFILNGITLIFQSTEDINLTIYARLHEEGSEEYLINEKVAELKIQAGLYDEIETDEPAEFEFSIQDFLKENAGLTETYYMTQYNQKTDVQCYGGLLGTGVGDGLVDKYGRALKIADSGDDVVLSSLYKVTKELKKNENNATGLINFLKEDSCYLEFVFETDVPAPFNIGYLFFDYEDPTEDD